MAEKKPGGKSLCSAEIRYRTLFEQSPDSVLIISAEGKILEFNEAAHRQLGYSREEFAKLSLFEIEADQNPAEIQESIRDVLSKGRAEFEVNHRAKNGEIRNTLVITQAMTVGGSIEFHTIWRDITEHKQADMLLRSSEEKYRDLFENANDPIFIIDASLHYVDVNKRAEEVFGYSRREYLSLTILDLIPPEQVPRSAAEFEKLRRRGQYEKFEGKMLRKDGTYADVEVSSSAMYKDGKIIGSRDIVRDITDRKRAQEALHRAKEELELRVQERTRELMESNRALLREIDERTKAESRLRASKELSDALNSINAVIHSKLDIDAILQSVVIEASTVIGVEASAIGLFQDDSFVIRHVYNLPEIVIGLRAPSAALKGLLHAAAVKDVVIFNDARTDERLNPDLVLTSGIYAMMVAPLVVKGSVPGAMLFYFFSPSRSFTDNDADFIRKLSASVSLALENAGLYQDRRRMEEDMRHMAHHDSLTGLPNRRLLTDIINFKVAEIRRNRRKLAVLFLDLDRFKEINDTLGHDAGDELLKQVAERLKSEIRESDTIARIGGDEFNIIVANINRAEDVTPIARKIMISFQRAFFIAGHELHISTSIGISVYPDDSDEINTLFRYADIAMYYAKEQGRNSYHFYNPAINVRSLEKIKMENYLRRSLDRGELLIHYQPQVKIGTRKIVCAEALVRWRHPEIGLLDPREFIPIAEETGFVTAIDQWVLRTACRQFKAWQDAGLRASCLAVNVSSKAFQYADFTDSIAQILAETGLAPHLLEIEITESTAMDDIDNSIERLRKLTGMGVRIAIDDFGTGYSSLNYLKRLPIRRLKIDQSFIKDIPTDPDDRAIIKAVTAMAHNMKMRVVAEGVETEEQLAFLQSTGCDDAQGFLFHRPLPPDRFKELISKAA